ncbi:phosphatase PAP2 family protein [Parafrankia discariae]|uniref:phosphatase PAP2 family protein n=1 Tax=Parafrankia discariae TaxID=365528 RepID=UPI0003644537|nr:phosphatase PAP2 family protein [Parafrankia discariae]
MVSIPFPSHGRAGSATGSVPVHSGSSGWRATRAGRAAGATIFFVGQVLLLGALYLIYRTGRQLAVGREPEALANARDVWSLERLLDLPNESAVQQLALHSTELLELANRFYIGVHFPASITFLLWVMIRHRDYWPRVRTVILASTGAALMIHILYPLAPPRFLPQELPHVTLIDTGAVFGPSPYTAGDTVANQYAAMPSLHVGWSILVAWGVVTILRSRARWLVIAHPVITTVVVVITANHYWLDGMIGGGLVATAVQLTRPEVHARMRLWTITAGQWVWGRAGEATVPLGGSHPGARGGAGAGVALDAGVGIGADAGVGKTTGADPRPGPDHRKGTDHPVGVPSSVALAAVLPAARGRPPVADLPVQRPLPRGGAEPEDRPPSAARADVAGAEPAGGESG